MRFTIWILPLITGSTFVALVRGYFELLDNSSGQVWRRLGELALITFLVSIILMLLLRT